MLSDPDAKIPTLKVLAQMTETQHSQLGLALRHTFFNTIREIGCEELTVNWLAVLSENGKTIHGFEKDLDALIAEWIKQTLLVNDHPLALHVLQLAQNVIQHNAAFLGEASMKTVVRTVCVRACRGYDRLTSFCLEILDSVLKYRTRKALISILNDSCVGQRSQGNRRANDEYNEKKIKMVLRGAIFCLASASWGTGQIDAVRYSLGSIIEPMRNVTQVDEVICADVLYGIRRLIQKYGRDLQHMTWVKLVELFETVVDLCEQRLEYAKTCENSLHQILLLIEQLYSDGHFAASPDLLYDLIEKCADRRPDTSVVKLIQYRAMAMSELHAFYTKYRALYEHELVTQLMIPVLQETENESSSRIQ
ncbi:hypothetical protein TELCIR_15871, partial [Teladorsagia circumcincta]